MPEATEMDGILGTPTISETLGDLLFEDQETSSLNMSYSYSIRPLLDVVQKLRNLNIMKEGIELPSIVVVGDESSGKSSVLESLAGVTLGICSKRVPLIIRLQKTEADDCGFFIEYNDKKKHITESQITGMLNSVTEKIAGTSKGICDTPITLHVKKIDGLDLTMVDLPSISREPEDMYQQVSKIIMQYISPPENIILNVLSATEDFHSSESMKMSQQVDENGERTLAVATAVDKVPEELVGAVNRGLSCVFVRKRVGGESHEEARKREADLFRSHPGLNMIDKSMVGIPMLAKRLMQIQAKNISQCFPHIVQKIDKTVLQKQSELRDLPQSTHDAGEAMTVLMKLINALKNSLNKLLIEGDYREFSEASNMHCAARLREMFENYYQELLSDHTVEDKKHFLVQETKMCEEAKGVDLPNFLPHSVFVNLLQNPIENLLRRSLRLTGEVWKYVKKVVIKVIDLTFQSYPCLLRTATRASRALFSKRKNECIQYVNQMIEMEKSVYFTLNPIFRETSTQLLQQKDEFIQGVRGIVEEQVCALASRISMPPQPDPFVFGNTKQTTSNFSMPTQPATAKYPNDTKTITIKGIGKVEVGEVLKTPFDRLEVAFNMKVRLIAYWKIVIQRVGNGIPLYLQFSYRNLIKNDLDGEIMKELSGVELSNALVVRIMEESPHISVRREKLNKIVESLIELQKEVAKIVYQVREVE